MKKLFLQYIYQNRFNIILFIAFSVVFLVVFKLYGLNTEPYFYSLIICLTIGITAAAVNFYRFFREHNQRQHILNNIFILTDELPEPKNDAEADYISAIKKLCNEYTAESNKFNIERNESIDYYTTWVHQIKTPISVMRMILQSDDTEQNRELLAELFRIEQYTEMVLCYFRLGENSSDFLFEKYDLDDIIKEAVHKFAPQFIRKRIRLDYKPVNLSVLTDRKWLLFIIEQLLSNAVKYTQKGCVSIFTEGNTLIISDTGIGIAPEDLPRIFEKGFTGYNGRADKKSTGLGLYLCKKTADKLSHKISVKSEIGSGSSFSISFHSND